MLRTRTVQLTVQDDVACGPVYSEGLRTDGLDWNESICILTVYKPARE